MLLLLSVVLLCYSVAGRGASTPVLTFLGGVVIFENLGIIALVIRNWCVCLKASNPRRIGTRFLNHDCRKRTARISAAYSPAAVAATPDCNRFAHAYRDN